MSLMRAFIAIPVSPEVRAKAEKISKKLQDAGGKVNWTRGENMHLTLRFLGDTPDARIPDVCRAVEKAASTVPPFTIVFHGLGAFPRTAQPRTIWIGAEEGAEPLFQLQETLEEELYDAGFPRERRRFKPHLTIGRVRSGGSTQQHLGQLIEEQADFRAGETTVDELVTMATFRDSQGPTYQALGHADLGS